MAENIIALEVEIILRKRIAGNEPAAEETRALIDLVATSRTAAMRVAAAFASGEHLDLLWPILYRSLKIEFRPHRNARRLSKSILRRFRQKRAAAIRNDVAIVPPWAKGRLNATMPVWFEGRRTGILRHCFVPDHTYVEFKIRGGHRQDIAYFVASLGAPLYLTAHQKMLLFLLQSIESWWSSGFVSMQSIHDESLQIMGFSALQMPPSPLPLRIQHRLKVIVRGSHAAAEVTDSSERTVERCRGTCGGDDHAGQKICVIGHFLAKSTSAIRRLSCGNGSINTLISLIRPTKKDKQLLSSVTGLTRMQVSTWFINERVRIPQPLVLELGKELGEDEYHQVDAEGGLSATRAVAVGDVSVPMQTATPVNPSMPLFRCYLQQDSNRTGMRW